MHAEITEGSCCTCCASKMPTTCLAESAFIAERGGGGPAASEDEYLHATQTNWEKLWPVSVFVTKNERRL